MAREQTFQISKNFFVYNNERYSRIYQPDVIRDINNYPGFEEKIKDFKNSFIEFAALQRMDYLPDLDSELLEYTKRRRMYQTNNSAWYILISQVLKRDNYTCSYCGAKGVKLELDHVIPFSKGGDDTVQNLAAACVRCNRQKKDKTVDEFLKWKTKNE